MDGFRRSQCIATAAIGFLMSIQAGQAQIFNYTTALSGWTNTFTHYPSAQTNSSILIVRQNMDMPVKLGAIFYNSIAQNQSYAVSGMPSLGVAFVLNAFRSAAYISSSDSTSSQKALRWLLRPVSDLSVPVPAANITDFNRVSGNLGAAVAYAMTYAYQDTTNYTAVIEPPLANGTILQSGTNPFVSVKPNATDVFYVAASALMGVVYNGCDANWRCHGSDCNGPEDIARKRVGVCCTSVSPMLSAISRQLHLFGNDYLIDDAMPAYVQAQNPTVLEFLSRCNRVDFGDASTLGTSACNSNASSNYMGSTVLLDVNSNTPGAPPVASALDCCLACIGSAQCNVWVYCGGEHGCSGCNGQALNYRAGAGSGGQTFGPYARGCYDVDGLGSLFPTGTCTLKSAVFRTSPQAYPSSGSFLAFTSGYLTPHSAS